MKSAPGVDRPNSQQQKFYYLTCSLCPCALLQMTLTELLMRSPGTPLLHIADFEALQHEQGRDKPLLQRLTAEVRPANII